MTIGTDTAFPVPNLQDDWCFNGLTKREYFSVLILNGIASGLGRGLDQRDVEEAVKQADFLILELHKDVS